jgi:hypothetical protein
LAHPVNVTGGKRDHHETPAGPRRRYVPRAMNLARTGFLSVLGCIFSTLSLVACGGSTANGFAGDAGAPGEGGGGGDDGGGGGDDGGGGFEAGTLPSGVVAVPLSACVPTVYTAQVTLGGSQSFNMLVDTGSTTLGVAGKGCSCGSVAPVYTPGASAVDQKQTAQSAYQSGSWSGEIYQDSVSTGTSAPAPTKIVSITSQTNFFDQQLQCDSKSGGMQGILGMGPPGAAVAGTNGFFDEYVATNKVPNVFATELCDTTGTLWLGGYDPAVTTAAPQYVPSNDFVSSLAYGVDLASITVAGKTVTVGQGQIPDTVVDTGTSIFLLNTNAYNGLVAALEGDAAFKAAFGTGFFPAANQQQQACAAAGQTKAQLDASLPALTLNFGGGASVKAAPTESYLVDVGGGQFCGALIGLDQSAMQGLSGIMGSPVLRSNVVIFDRAQKRIGFAPHAPCN